MTARVLFGDNVAVDKSKKNFTAAGAMAILTFSLAAFGWIQLVDNNKTMVILLVTTAVWLILLGKIARAVYKKVFEHERFIVHFTWAFVTFEVLRLRDIVDRILLLALLAVWIVVTVMITKFNLFASKERH